MKATRDRRKEYRLGFEGKLPGRLRHKTEDLTFAPFDVSKKGLGLYLNPCPEEGEELSLDLDEGETKGPTLRFTVRHIYGESQGIKRCGVELKLDPSEQEIDLIELLTRYF